MGEGGEDGGGKGTKGNNRMMRGQTDEADTRMVWDVSRKKLVIFVHPRGSETCTDIQWPEEGIDVQKMALENPINCPCNLFCMLP
jgi:hypothetical protein